MKMSSLGTVVFKDNTFWLLFMLYVCIILSL